MFKVFDIAREALGSVAKAAAKVPVIENKYHMNERLRGPWPKGPFLWMHGASLGECKMLLNLAKCLKEDLPNCPRLLLTTQKVEVVSFIKESGVDVVAHIAPVDAPATMKSFISSVK
ncbi:MAG: 3-deoxy-D-manno-octulosonic acid transferase, partial [Fibrobacter sp.]|nr:3-deoxy-D-manno-octulosonic acid transferase [Fibrobacter sp.]